MDEGGERFREEVGEIVKKLLNEQGNSHLTLSDEALDIIYKQVEREVIAMLRRSDQVAELCLDSQIKPGHLALANHTTNILHGLSGDEEVVVQKVMQASPLIKEDTELRRARERRDALEIERRQHKQRLLENNRRRVSDNISFIRKSL